MYEIVDQAVKCLDLDEVGSTYVGPDGIACMNCGAVIEEDNEDEFWEVHLDLMEAADSLRGWK